MIRKNDLDSLKITEKTTDLSARRDSRCHFTLRRTESGRVEVGSRWARCFAPGACVPQILGNVPASVSLDLARTR